MAANYLDFGLSDSLSRAIERHNARRDRFNENIDSTLQNLSEAARTAYKYKKRKELVDQFGGDENDAELKTAKAAYLESGDPSLLINYEQTRKQNKLTKDANDIAAEKNKIEAGKESAKRRIELVGAVDSAASVLKDATKGGASPSNAQLTSYNNALKALKNEYPEEAANYGAAESHYSAKPESGSKYDLQAERLAFEKDFSNALSEGKSLSEENIAGLLDTLEKLHSNGLDWATYSGWKSQLRGINPAVAKATEEAENAATTKARGEVAYHQSQADRAEAKSEKKKKKEEELKAEKEVENNATSWLNARSSLSDEELKSVLSVAKIDEKIKKKIKEIKGW